MAGQWHSIFSFISNHCPHRHIPIRTHNKLVQHSLSCSPPRPFYFNFHNYFNIFSCLRTCPKLMPFSYLIQSLLIGVFLQFSSKQFYFLFILFNFLFHSSPHADLHHLYSLIPDIFSLQSSYF